MSSFVYEFRYLQAGAEVLEDFLLAQDIYWPIGIQAPRGETPYPQLSLGGLHLARARATAKAQTAGEQSQLARAGELLDGAQRKWRVAWEQKSANEYRARLTQWRNYIDDYQENPDADYDRYSYEVGRRAILQFLDTEAGELPVTERELLGRLDSILKSLLLSGEFIWEADLKPVFPKDKFWFLYGRLPKEVNHRAK